MEELTRKYGGYRLVPHAKKKEARWKYHLKWITMFTVIWMIYFALGWLALAVDYKVIDFLWQYKGISATLIGFVAMYAAIAMTYNYFDRR